MTSRFFTLVVTSLLVAATASSTIAPRTYSRLPHAAGVTKLHAYGTRGRAQPSDAASAKYDSALADITRHLSSVRADHAIADLHALHPAARFRQSAAGEPLVLVDAITRGDPEQLKSNLVALGLQKPAVFSNDVSGWLPVSQLSAAARSSQLHSIRAAMPRTRAGLVTSQGDFVQHSDVVRSANALDGAGVTVGVLSDSYSCYAYYAANGPAAGGDAGYANNGFTATASTDVSTGDLPSTVNVLKEANCPSYGAGVLLPFGDEGRAMLQIVHDVAPGAGLAFYTAENGEADFANGILALATATSAIAPGAGVAGAGAKVIVDDVGYFDEPFFQDGLIAEAVNQVHAQGVAYFSSAGNNGTYAYDNIAPSFLTPSTIASSETLLTFDASVGTSFPVTIPALVPGEFVGIVLEWDQPFVTGAPHSTGATSQLDLCVTGAQGNDVLIDNNTEALTALSTNCTGLNALGSDPNLILIVGNPASATSNSDAETLNIVVGLANSSVAPGRIKLAVEADGAQLTLPAFAQGGTLQGHPSALGAAAVGAAFYFDTPACGATPAILEYYSSAGGDPTLFDSTGTRISPVPVPRQKPDFVGPDGGNDTFLGYTLADAGVTGGQLNTTIAACQNVSTLPNFFGTSAAAPHVASIAALYLQANPALAPDAIFAAMRSTALPVVQSDGSSAGSSTYNRYGGSGFVQADLAAAVIAAVVPPAPMLTLASASIGVNSSTTLTWSSSNNQGCTASGSWSGALASSGSQTITPSATGSDTYTLTCSNTAGTSSATSVVLTVTAPVPAAPTLTVSPNSITVGASSTLTWSSSNATACTASGAWSGSEPTSGSLTVSPTATGSSTYTLSCSNATGSSAAASAVLTVNAVASSGGGHGGGSVDRDLLFALLMLAGIRFYSLNQRHRVSGPAKSVP